jgi:hypothetical protein
VTGGNRVEAVRWQLSSGEVMVLRGAPSDLVDGTPTGWAVTGGGDERAPARVAAPGTVELLPLPAGGQPYPAGAGAFAASVSDDGTVITGATGTGTGDRRPLIWRCTS